MRFLVVGGVAVVMHGYLRTTLDLDLVVQLEEKNLRRALEVLSNMGMQPRPPVPLLSFADPTQRRQWVHEKNMKVFSLWHPQKSALEVDLFVEEPFDFDSVYARSAPVPLEAGGTPIRLIGVRDLIAMKQAVGRHRDLDDIEALEALQAESNEPEP
ncbi:MAG: DUF6036 family nucleotidyltransferase [Acidobacteriota bacterium]